MGSLPGKLHSRFVALKTIWASRSGLAVALKEAFSRPGHPGPSVYCKSFFFLALEEGPYDEQKPPETLNPKHLSHPTLKTPRPKP